MDGTQIVPLFSGCPPNSSCEICGQDCDDVDVNHQHQEGGSVAVKDTIGSEYQNAVKRTTKGQVSIIFYIGHMGRILRFYIDN